MPGRGAQVRAFRLGLRLFAGVIMQQRRHWIDRMAGRSILLEGSAEPVPHYTIEDREIWISVIVKGAPHLIAVFCGPAAPLPGLPYLVVAEGIAAVQQRIGLCNRIGPDGALCELAPLHVALPDCDGRMHAATMDEGLVRW